MAGVDLCEEKRVRLPKGKHDSDLPQEIEKLKVELNRKVAQGSKGLNNEETLELSQKLDELLVQHLQDELGLITE
ncbi:MAG: aspartyl-phosphate phosphatase Spo0E family protein [Clostridiaceae bacterium]|jgi:hypothetical protein|nr:aspartyl-phosphate phosphatase Spo0E family protein [Bacillota bacterium]NLI38546.1 aspartyl-phosphate phosphatase Spo0E family protein [Clostridiaceae bacterium]